MKKIINLALCGCLALSVFINQSVYADEIVEIDHNSWGCKSMMVDEYIQYANEYSKGNEAIVAVLDSGVNYNHVFLKDRMLYDSQGKLIGYDFVDEDDNPMDDGQSYHGTHVAGIVADMTQTLNVKIMPVRVSDTEGYLDSKDVAEGIYFAVDHGANVINCSFYVDTGDFSLVDEAVEYAIQHHVAIVVAAGNQGSSLDDELIDQCPQHISDVICVAALQEQNKISGEYYNASFSNYGNNVDFSAPGMNILSCDGSTTNGYKIMSGTSMAAPHISACIAMLYLIDPNLSLEQVQKILIDSVSDVGNVGKDIFSGYGIPQMKYVVCSDIHHEFRIITYCSSKATCGNEGYTGDQYCIGCDKLLQKGSIIPATDMHTWNQGVVTKVATKTSEGIKTYTCTVCKQTKTVIINKLSNDTTDSLIVKKTTTIPNTGIYLSNSPLLCIILVGLIMLQIKRKNDE